MIENYTVEVHGERTEEITRTDTYRGQLIELVTEQSPARTVRYEWKGELQVRDEPSQTWRSARIDGRTFRRPAGDDDAVIRKLRAGIDRGHEDRELLPQLEYAMRRDAARPVRGAAVGDIASVHAMGRMRTGYVVKVTARKATIAYTTPSSGGRVFRKATDLLEPVEADLSEAERARGKAAAARVFAESAAERDRFVF